MVTQLQHARVLGSTEGVRENQLRFLTPSAAAVFRADRYEITIWVGVAGALFTQEPPFGSTPEGYQQFAIGPAYDRRKCGMKLVVFIDDDVFHLRDARWLFFFRKSQITLALFLNSD